MGNTGGIRVRQSCLAVLLMIVPTTVAWAQLTTSQREADLGQVAALYDKNYGSYEWKRDVIGFDLLDLDPWARRARSARGLDFNELLHLLGTKRLATKTQGQSGSIIDQKAPPILPTTQIL